MQIRRPFAFPFLLLNALTAGAAVGCSSAGAADPSTSTEEPGRPGPGNADGGDAPKAPDVDGTALETELNEAYGVFVAPGGDDANAGARAKPLATIQAGIDLGKRLGKRVYVCTGTYRESLTLADSIAVIGALVCTDPTSWKTGGLPTRIEAKTSPALRAKDIVTPTRLEGLDVVAPDATEPSASSIGLLADHAPALTLARSSIRSGNGADGAAGAAAIQLTPVASFDGNPGRDKASCDGISGNLNCPRLLNNTSKYANPDGNPRPGTCLGEAGHDGESGGAGGAGGIWKYVEQQTMFTFSVANPYDATLPAKPGEAKSGQAGAAGTDATAGAAVGTLGADGYVAEPGRAGTAGTPGAGGSGGNGTGTTLFDNQTIGSVWRGITGPGGGAGGCPGLAGRPGDGGGASIALALVESPIVVDDVKLTAGKGGQGGAGSFGSNPTIGGAPGLNVSPVATDAAKPGGNGGRAGISTNGASGPSFGIFHSGPAPTVKASTITPGAGGAGVEARSSADALGNARTIPASPAGLSKDVFTL